MRAGEKTSRCSLPKVRADIARDAADVTAPPQAKKSQPQVLCNNYATALQHYLNESAVPCHNLKQKVLCEYPTITLKSFYYTFTI